MNTSGPLISQGLLVFYNIMPFLGYCIHWYSNHMVYCLTTHSISAFMLIKYTDSLARSHVISIPMWLLCSWSSMCFCNENVMIIQLPFIATPSIIARLCLIVQHLHRVGSKSSLFCGQPLITYACGICSSASIFIAFLMSSIDVHTGTSIALLNVCILMDVHINYLLVFVFSMIVVE